ncbi:hypothetical protein D3C83_151120 [compost metagenome]
MRELIQRELDRFSEGFKSYERPKQAAITTTDFTIENGMITPSLKLKRRAVMSKYGAALDALFQNEPRAS